MGRMVNPISDDEGCPVPHDVDGLDTRRIANREGFNRQLGRRLNERTEWTNSRTGKKCDPPEYANED